jgi:hypothetical protein
MQIAGFCGNHLQMPQENIKIKTSGNTVVSVCLQCPLARGKVLLAIICRFPLGALIGNLLQMEQLPVVLSKNHQNPLLLCSSIAKFIYCRIPILLSSSIVKVLLLSNSYNFEFRNSAKEEFGNGGTQQ